MNGIAKNGWNLIAAWYPRVLFQVEWFDAMFVNVPWTAMGSAHLCGL